MLSTHDDVRFAEHALQVGARGFLLKQQAPELLIGAIREVLAGRRYVSPQMTQEILQQDRQPAATGRRSSVAHMNAKDGKGRPGSTHAE
jgi:DNA-binding NarL/FixJ family response regulator